MKVRSMFWVMSAALVLPSLGIGAEPIEIHLTPIKLKGEATLHCKPGQVVCGRASYTCNSEQSRFERAGCSVYVTCQDAEIPHLKCSKTSNETIAAVHQNGGGGTLVTPTELKVDAPEGPLSPFTDGTAAGEAQ